VSETIFKQMSNCGQSIWLDYISRSLIDTGKLKHLVKAGLRGLTSNPTIFDNAVSRSNDYDSRIRELKVMCKNTFGIYDAVTVKDIQDAADAFGPVYERTDGLDGYVSLEINPQLAHDTGATIEEGKRLHRKVNRPNVMFKVPATDEGFPAIEALVSESINVNVTLIFSVEQYVRTATAYLRGLEALIEKRRSARIVRSVASVFVSRIDTLIDRLIEEKLQRIKDTSVAGEMMHLKGKAAVANSVVIYDKFREIFSGARFRRLQENGCSLQRVLWGSTSTKNPEYNDIKYVTELIGRDTVNTIPSDTLEAFMDHGSAIQALPGDAEQARAIMDELMKIGIDINEVCSTLLTEGVVAFQKSFDSLLGAIEEKAAEL
jgi:transaldolase